MRPEPLKPPRIKPKLISAPKIKQVYWCTFPQDAQLPEFWKLRPVIVVSYRNNLYGTVTVIACSTKEQSNNKWAVPITINNTKSWAICDKITTVAVSRLTQFNKGIIKLSESDFNNVITKMLEWLPEIG